MPAGFITVKVQPGYDAQAIAAARRELTSLFPEAPFEYEFLESSYNRQYTFIDQFEFLIYIFAAVAILISCSGLFALSAYSVQTRTREIAVRKVFGAKAGQVLVLLTAKYVKIVLLSSLIGACITFYVMGQWLQNFAFAITLSPGDFAGALALLVCIALSAVAYHCIKASRRNPARALSE